MENSNVIHQRHLSFPDHVDNCLSPIAVSAQTISDCASLLPPLSPQSPTLVSVSSGNYNSQITSLAPGSSSVTLLVPMNGPIAPKPGEKVFIETAPQISSSSGTVFLLPKPGNQSGTKTILTHNSMSNHNDGIKLLIPVKGPSKHGETIFIKNAPNPGGPVFLIPSQTDPNEKVLVPATSQEGGSSGAIILVPQPKSRSSRHNTLAPATSRRNPKRTKAATGNPKGKSSPALGTSKKKPTTDEQRTASLEEVPKSDGIHTKGLANSVLKSPDNTSRSATVLLQKKNTNSPGVTTRNGKKASVRKASMSVNSTVDVASNNKAKASPTKTMCIPPMQRQPIILGDRARQMYEKNVNELKSLIKAQKRKIQKQQRDLDKLRSEKKDGVKHLPKKHLCKLIRKHLPGYVGQFIEAQLINYGVEVKNKHRWEMSDKVFALAMWHRSPLAYKLLRETFAMPSVKTLQHWTATVPPELDFYDVLKELVRKKLPTDEEDEDCVDKTKRKSSGADDSVDINEAIGDLEDSDTVIESDANDDS